MRRFVPIVLSLVVGCAPPVALDADEMEPKLGPTLEFDPSSGLVPFPSNLMLDPVAQRVRIPRQCHETEMSTVLREQGLNTLDGFGALEVPLRVTFTKAVDPTTLSGKVFLFRSNARGVPDNPATTSPVPMITLPGSTTRYDAACEVATTVDTLTIIPTEPLQTEATYSVAILSGIKTMEDEFILPSSTWALLRQAHKPVEVVIATDGSTRVVQNHTSLDPLDAEDLVALGGIDRLWDFHRDTLTFLDVALAYRANGRASPAFPRSDILLAWSFRTQTVEEPLDASVRDTPAAQIGSLAPDLPAIAPAFSGDVAVAAAFHSALSVSLGGADPCLGTIPCGAVGSILSGSITSPSFQTRLPNPIGLMKTLPGPWDDPLSPNWVSNEMIPLVGFVPKSAAPLSGYPVIIFGHGLGGTKEALYAFGAQLANAGFASIAIDWINHGSRAVQINNASGIGCSGTPDPAIDPHCFATLFSSDLLGTRDNMRQTLLDLSKLVRAVRACGVDGCTGFPVDPNRIGYVGQSLGGILGTIAAAMNPEIKAAVLNVAGSGWIDILTDTDADDLRCPLVDDLIDAGVIAADPSEKWLNGLNPTPLCKTVAWRTDPSFVAFAATARWILDASDGANFARSLAASERSTLLQEVVRDSVVPNSATHQLGKLLGLDPTRATSAVNLSPTATAATIAGGGAWITYATLPPNAGAGFPGNAYSHASLLAPANTGIDGKLGTAQMQADAIAFLLANL